MASTIHIILASGFKGACELTLNVVTSGVLEGLFRPFDPTVSPWINLLEGTVEIALYLLLAGTGSSLLDEFFTSSSLSQLPYGSLLMFWLLEGAIAKINHFVSYLATKMNIRRVAAKPLVIDAGPDDSSTAKESMDTSSTCTAPACQQ